MALAERADLIARLTLDDRFSGKVRGALGNLRGMETSFSKIGKLGQQGLKNAATNLAKIGAVAGGFVAINVKAGISSLAELEDATTSVDGAIQQLGLTGKVTSAQIAGWANEIERNTQAAFDDKAITAATAQLIRYGKVTADNLRPAMEVMTDLAARTGDVGSASNLLARALADPEKAAGKLAKQGIILTAQQEKQIKKMVEAGDAAGAQAKLLDILAQSTKGAAAASKGPYNDAINILTDSVEDAQRVLGEGFLPVISKVADKLQDAVADEGFMREVREFGQNMAGAFDKAVEFAGNVPWGLIGQSLKTAGQGAKAIFDAFTMLPPWVQQAVITGWGLNKLTGGALGSIVGELGKGLIKGVLGMTAGVVNIKAGVVNGAGGTAGAGGGVANAVGLGIAGAVVAQGVVDAATIATGFQKGYQASQQGDVQGILDAQRDTLNSIVLLPPGIRELGNLFTSEQKKIAAAIAADKNAQLTASERTRSAIQWGTNRTTSVTRSGDMSVVAAIRRIQRPIVSVSVVGNTIRTVYSTGGTVTRNVSTGSMNAGLLA